MVFSKSLFFEGVTLIIGVLWILSKLYKTDKWPIPKNITLLIFGIYTLVLLISGFSGVLPVLSFWGSADHGLGVIFMLCLFIFVVITSSILKTKEDWYKLFTIFSVSGIIFTLGAFLSKVGVHFSKVLNITLESGFTIGNSSWTGIYLAFVFFISLGLVFSSKNKSQKVIGIIGMITSFFDPILTGFIMHADGKNFSPIGLAQTASYSLMVGIGLFVLYLIFRKIESEKWRKVFIGSFLSVILIGIISISIIGLNPIRNLIAEKAGPNRLVFWNIAIEGWKEKPLLGWGGDSYQYIYSKYFDPIITTPGYAPEYWVDRSHSYYFDELATGGILGFISLLLLYGTILFGLIRKAVIDRSKEGLLYMALFAGVVSFLVQGLMIFQTIMGWFIVGLIVAFVANFCFKDRSNVVIKNNKNNSKDESFNIFISFITIIIFGILFNYLIIKPYKIINGLAKFPTLHYDKKLEFYKELDNSYFGNLVDLGNAFNPYHIRLRKILKLGLSKEKKEIMINEIKNINILLDNSLKKQKYMDMKLLVSAMGMNSVLVALIDGPERQEYFNKGMFYIEKMKIISPENPIAEMSIPILEFPLKYGEEGLDVLDVSDVKLTK